MLDYFSGKSLENSLIILFCLFLVLFSFFFSPLANVLSAPQTWSMSIRKLSLQLWPVPWISKCAICPLTCSPSPSTHKNIHTHSILAVLQIVPLPMKKSRPSKRPLPPSFLECPCYLLWRLRFSSWHSLSPFLAFIYVQSFRAFLPFCTIFLYRCVGGGVN